MERFAQVKEDFDSLCFVVTNALHTDGLYAQIRTYVLSAIMQIWGSNVLYAPDAAYRISHFGRKIHIDVEDQKI